MRWVPRWLGECYVKLFLEYGEKPFSSEACQRNLHKGMNSVRVALSKLAKEGYLVKERVGRRVLYRCLDPYKVVLRVEGLVKIPQQEYSPLAEEFVSESLKFLGDDLLGIVLYGSIARGEANENSDMDVLLVARDLPGSFATRVEYLYPMKRSCRDAQIELWREKAIYCSIQIYPLLPDELEVFRPLFLDITTDGKVLFDRVGLMEEKLEEWRRKLSEVRARKVVLPNRSWYWDLGVEREEVVEI